MRGLGATLDGKAIEVDPFVGFEDREVAAAAILASKAGKSLDPSAFTGAVLIHALKKLTTSRRHSGVCLIDCLVETIGLGAG